MNKILIICGPTATGKTSFGLEVAKQFSGEIISADSRQVHVGNNIVTGKDLPPTAKYQISNIKWRDRYLKYYEVDGTKIWLYDVVSPGESFNVSFWKECVDIVISDVESRELLPIVVGGTGLFIKSLTHDLSLIDIPFNPHLRNELAHQSPQALFDYLNSIAPDKATGLNKSDRLNPRRLLRAIEISSSSPSHKLGEGGKGGEVLMSSAADILTLGLTTPRPQLYRRINQRVLDRIAAGAAAEDQALASNPVAWQHSEHGLARRQLTWFKKQPNINWFDITTSNWQTPAFDLIGNWYNNL